MGNAYAVNVDQFVDPSGRYFDFNKFEQAIDSGELEPVGEHEIERPTEEEYVFAAKEFESYLKKIILNGLAEDEDDNTN